MTNKKDIPVFTSKDRKKVLNDFFGVWRFAESLAPYIAEKMKDKEAENECVGKRKN